MQSEDERKVEEERFPWLREEREKTVEYRRIRGREGRIVWCVFCGHDFPATRRQASFHCPCCGRWFQREDLDEEHEIESRALRGEE